MLDTLKILYSKFFIVYQEFKFTWPPAEHGPCSVRGQALARLAKQPWVPVQPQALLPRWAPGPRRK